MCVKHLNMHIIKNFYGYSMLNKWTWGCTWKYDEYIILSLNILLLTNTAWSEMKVVGLWSENLVTYKR
jgi:hypothetical protein